MSNGTVSAGQYEFEFPSLLKYYAYSVTVLAFTVKGDGALSKEVVAMTEEDGKEVLNLLYSVLVSNN